MSPAQVKAAQILLAKTLPDLKATEITAGDNTQLGFVLMGAGEAKNAVAWRSKHTLKHEPAPPKDDE